MIYIEQLDIKVVCVHLCPYYLFLEYSAVAEFNSPRTHE